MADLTVVKDMTEIGANVATILGIPIAIILFMRDRNKERADKSLEAYDRLDERYIDYVKLCLEHPDLDVFEVSLNQKTNDSSGETEGSAKRREIMLFTILISIFERAYVTYMAENSKNQAISEWQAYIRYWCAKENFQRAWRKINIQNQLRKQPGVQDTKTGYNVAFVEQIEAWIQEAQSRVDGQPQVGRRVKRARN